MSKRILLIEDTEDNRQILRDLFASTDYELIEAKDGAEGVAIAKSQRPDLSSWIYNYQYWTATRQRGKSRQIPHFVTCQLLPSLHALFPTTKPKRERQAATPM
jgi:PleD family two-component response regulator